MLIKTITKLLAVSMLLSVSILKAQSLASVFIDTLDITVSNKKIYSSGHSSLKFIPNKKDADLTVYNDSTYKLMIRFRADKYEIPSVDGYSGVVFYRKDSIISLDQITSSDYEDCSETFMSRFTFQNWHYGDPPPTEKTQIKLCFRLTNYAPADTSNYKYNYRQGLWVGASPDAQKILLNYQNDKKNGISRAIYKDGRSYVVSFVDNTAENYGLGYWENTHKKANLKASYHIPSILSSCDFPNSPNYTSFILQRKHREKEVSRHWDLSVHFDKKGIRHDSIEYHVRGDFISISNDSMIIQTEEMDTHNFYRRNTDSLHFFFTPVSSGFAKVPLKDISRIYYTRSLWNGLTINTTLLSLTSAFIVSPLISIQKEGFNHQRFRQVTSVSLGVAVLSVSFGIAFSQKKFLIRPTSKSNKTWTINPQND
ncbi:MAG: hypothetical protein JST26_13305 [Bacteroidetes bacterium]|nr:hypothetical protein [Bacteroidota bacterium]